MSNPPPRPNLDLAGLIGATDEALHERLGPASVDRASGTDRWRRYEGAGWALKVRLAPAENEAPPRVRAWTATFEAGFASLEEACEALSLDPVAPTEIDRAVEPALFRRCLPDPASGALHSLTASSRAGVIGSVTAFDEAPDWREAPAP